MDPTSLDLTAVKAGLVIGGLILVCVLVLIAFFKSMLKICPPTRC